MESQIIEEASNLYKKIMQNGIPMLENKDEFIEYIKKEHADLYHIYYFPVKTMIFYGLWNETAFKKYMKEMAELGMNITLKDQVPANANYLSEVIRIRDSLSGSDFRKMRRDIRKELEDEYNSFDETSKNAMEEFDKNEEKYKQERVEDAKKFILDIANAKSIL